MEEGGTGTIIFDIMPGAGEHPWTLWKWKQKSESATKDNPQNIRRRQAFIKNHIRRALAKVGIKTYVSKEGFGDSDPPSKQNVLVIQQQFYCWGEVADEKTKQRVLEILGTLKGVVLISPTRRIEKLDRPPGLPEA